jgi:drug/metabolite transporter (DMT)-like permease
MGSTTDRGQVNHRFAMTARAPRHPGRLRLAAAYLAVCTIWGSTYYAIRIVVQGGPPLLLGAIRFLIAGGTLYVVARARSEAPPSRKEWASAVLTGALFFVVGNGFLILAERSVSSGIASVIVATLPLWTALFARFMGHPVSRTEAAGLVLGLVGVGVLNVGGEQHASAADTAFILFAPMGWALGSVVTPRLPLPGGTMRIAAQMLAGGVGLLVLACAAGERLSTMVPVPSLLALGYLIVFGSLVGFSAYTLLLEHTRPAVATSYAYVNPVVAILIGAIFGGERFGAASLSGSAIVLVGVTIVGLSRTQGSGTARR